MFLLFDGSVNGKYLYKHVFKVYDDIAQEFGAEDFKFGSIDAKCHSEFRDYFDINHILLPVVVAYNPVSRRISFEKLYEKDVIRTFFKKVAGFQQRTFKKGDGLEDHFTESDCKEFHAKNPDNQWRSYDDEVAF